MAKLTKTKNGTIRLVCDCGRYVHEMFKDEKDEIVVDTFERKPDEPAPQVKPPETPAAKKKDKWDIFGE